MKYLSLALALAAVCVSLLCGCQPPKKPVLATSETSHSFAGGEATWTFQVWNAGEAGTTLNFDVTSNQDYVTAVAAAGQSTGPDDKVDVTVTINAVPLLKARLSADVQITSDGGDANVTVDYSATIDKYALWTHGTRLRGANISQRRVYPELDGPTFMGSGKVGPPYSQEDFNRLAALGANYVNLSHPGLFTESAPYQLDTDVQANLDDMVAKAEAAGLYVVISARTGPERSEFTFERDLVPESYINDKVWTTQAAQDAWVAMWLYTANRYKTHANVIGFDLMVEPNANAVLLNDYDPEHFYANYRNTLYDWNQFHPRIAAGIRAVDPDTPILVGGMSYAAASWLPYLALTGQSRSVYLAHMYEPMNYSHQDASPPRLTYPGRFDADEDGTSENVNKDWLAGQFDPIDQFQTDHGVPVAVNEFGVHRFAPGADKYLADMMDLLEQRGLNHALWVFNTSYTEYAEVVDDFDFLHGSNANNHSDTSSALLDVIQGNWSQNGLRP